MDTANVLQIRAGLEIVEADIAELRAILAGLSWRHRDTPIAGRTHLQQALPVIFGYKRRSGWRCSTAIDQPQTHRRCHLWPQQQTHCPTAVPP
jgi:adenylosuccinate lyase